MVKAAGYKTGTIDNAGSSLANTVAMFAPGHEAEAKRLAKAIESQLGDTPTQAMTTDASGSRGRRPPGARRGARRLRSSGPGAASGGPLAMQLPVADLYDLAVDLAFQLPAYVSLAAALACAVLLPLYFSQRRDLQRLHAWMEREPGHPQADIAASEALLDRAETELEALFGPEPRRRAVSRRASRRSREPTAVAPPPRPAPTPAAGLPAAQRVTTERPALERITMERAALLPHPRWRRLVAPGQPAARAFRGGCASRSSSAWRRSSAPRSS